MKKDIVFHTVQGIQLAVIRNQPTDSVWEVHIINNNDYHIEGVIIVSKGYGYTEENGEKQKTSILRHLIEAMPARSSALVEPIDNAVLHLFNEYWVSYYKGKEIYDKKFVFVPESIVEQNLSYIPQLEREGVLHK
jgi:hypothetical protein